MDTIRDGTEDTEIQPTKPLRIASTRDSIKDIDGETEITKPLRMTMTRCSTKDTDSET